MSGLGVPTPTQSGYDFWLPEKLTTYLYGGLVPGSQWIPKFMMLKSLLVSGTEQCTELAQWICEFPTGGRKIPFSIHVWSSLWCEAWEYRSRLYVYWKNFKYKVDLCSSDPCCSRVNCVHPHTHTYHIFFISSSLMIF